MTTTTIPIPDVRALLERCAAEHSALSRILAVLTGEGT